MKLIWLGARARMLSGAPKDADLPKGYDLDEAYRRSQAVLRERERGDG